MKIFNLLFCLLFVLFAALQYNDPDPYIWIPIYLYAAVLCWLAFRNKFYAVLYWLGILAYGTYASYLIFTKNGVLDWIKFHRAENIAATMKAEQPWIELAREFFGLIILIAVMLINYLYCRKKIPVSIHKRGSSY
jgi:hypothetical protein